MTDRILRSREDIRLAKLPDGFRYNINRNFHGLVEKWELELQRRVLFGWTTHTFVSIPGPKTEDFLRLIWEASIELAEIAFRYVEVSRSSNIENEIQGVYYVPEKGKVRSV